ncbi:MAG: DNA repair protein RecN [Luteitalea sp.]|nr:DNA repair protein RecN [Luteitalea sp.]
MIRYVSIRQLAVIDTLDLELGPGLTVFTGETGAGKSILVEAVGLLLGGRASADLVRTGAPAAQIQAVLETADGRETILRREISAQGRSRAFVDDVLVTSTGLREAVADLVDLHGQHAHQSLLQADTQLELLDRFADLAPERASCAARYEVWRALQDQLDAAQLDDRERTARIDLLTFQLDEIDGVAPQRGEDEELAATRQVLANADRIQQLGNESYERLYEGDVAVLAQLDQVWRRVADLAALDRRFEPYVEGRDVVKAHLEDLAFFLRSFLSDLDASPERLQVVEDRLAALERLKRRHGPTLDEVLRHRGEMAAALAALETSTERAAQLQEQVARAADAYQKAARHLSTRRREAASHFTERLTAALGELAMERTRCDIRFGPEVPPSRSWTANGFDQVEIFLSPNPGEELRPLARIASGGELSRIMLAMKTLASPDAPGKTLIFDEVDAGIGGRVADTVGAKLRRLANDVQVLCITHLPQVAAHAQAHVNISKHVVNERTITQATVLDANARAAELARMMGGEVSTAVLEGARAMLAAKSEGKPDAGNARRRAGHRASRSKSSS